MFGLVGLPHGFCFLWNPSLLWLHVVSDSLIALAYFLIPVALVKIVRGRRDLPFNAVFFCFAAFIVACGLTHVMEVVTLWYPIYWVSGVLKAITAAVSLATLVLLVRVVPAILAMPGKLADRRFQELIEDAPDAIVQVDAEGAIVIANRTAETMFGYSREELLSASVDRLIPPRNRAAHPTHREHFMRGGVTRPMGVGMGDLHALRKDGTEFPVEIGLSPVATDTGMHVTAVIRDVTSRKRIERELARERALRDQRLEVLARLSGGVAHEIKNPLAIIHARASDLAERALEETPTAEEVARTCASIVKTSDRAIRILRGLESLSRGGTRDAMQKAHVRDMVAQTVDLVERRYQTHNVALETVVPDGLPMLECREVQIGQVLMNLLNNAFDAIDGARPAAGTNGGAPQRWVRIEVSIEGAGGNGRMLIDVVDSGPGVPEHAREHLMETFYTTKPVGSGMGIGLSVSRAIAEDHGGSLVLIDKEGHTCFRLSLPMMASRANEVTA